MNTELMREEERVREDRKGGIEGEKVGVRRGG